MTAQGAFRFFISTALISLLTLSCAQQGGDKQVSQKPVASAEPLRICTGTTYSILPTIAEQKGLFAKEGLKVEMKQYAIGRDAMEAMLAGKCDIATSADTPVADYGLKREDLKVIAGIAKSDRLCCIVARKGTGILKVRDIQGHRVGVTKATAPHFFLDLVLNKNRLTEKDVKLQFMKGEELHKALADGRLDAIATTDMNAYKIMEKWGDNAVFIDDPGIALNFGYVVTLDSTLLKRKDDLRRMMTALKAAERIVVEKPDEAKQLFAVYQGLSSTVADRIWDNVTPKLSLDLAMVLTLEDNARWLRESYGQMAINKSFRSIIMPEMLKEVAPERVNF
mgnify:CR=1 FL=1